MKKKPIKHGRYKILKINKRLAFENELNEQRKTKRITGTRPKPFPWPNRFRIKTYWETINNEKI